MELSPLARERLKKIGALTDEERQSLGRESKLSSLLSEYFKGDLDVDGLWKAVNGLKTDMGEPVVAEAQGKLIDTLRLQMTKEEFERRRDGVLALETLKEQGNYGVVEAAFKSIEGLREQYQAEKDQAYQQVKATLAKQMESFAEQAKMQGLSVDAERSAEANVRNSPQWKDFLAKHDQSHEQTFKRYWVQLRDAL